MIDWALTGFKPLGFKGLRPPKASGEVAAGAGRGAGVGSGHWCPAAVASPGRGCLPSAAAVLAGS